MFKIAKKLTVIMLSASIIFSCSGIIAHAEGIKDKKQEYYQEYKRIIREANEKIGSNNTLQITATIKPENADDKSLTWSSSDDTIATVSNTGLVTPKKEGNVIITCTTNDGSNISKTCNIQILNGSLIYTRAELDAIRNNPGGSYILMNDIEAFYFTHIQTIHMEYFSSIIYRDASLNFFYLRHILRPPKY